MTSPLSPPAPDARDDPAGGSITAVVGVFLAAASTLILVVNARGMLGEPEHAVVAAFALAVLAYAAGRFSLRRQRAKQTRSGRLRALAILAMAWGLLTAAFLAGDAAYHLVQSFGRGPDIRL